MRTAKAVRPGDAMTDEERDDLRRIQDELIRRNPDLDPSTRIGEGGPMLGQLKTTLFPEWRRAIEGLIDGDNSGRKLTLKQSVMVAENRWLALKFARDWQGGRLDFDERVSLAYLGLCRAAIAFDPSLGSFATYAYLWMGQHIRRAIRTDFTIHVPDYVNFKSDDDPDEDIRARRDSAQRARMCGSFPDEFDPGDCGPPRADHGPIPCAESLIAILRRETRSVVEQAVIDGRSLADIGVDMGVSRERARQIRDRGLAHLRSLLA